MTIVLPTNDLLKKLGPLIREKRIQLHLSQAEVAKGICTQATISALENGRSFYYWQALPAIMKRLEIDLEILNEKPVYQYGERQLKRAEKKLIKRKFEEANLILTKIRPENIETRKIKQRFFCCSGYVCLFCNGKLDDAISNFQMVLANIPKANPTVHLVWCNFGLAIAYYKLGFQKCAVHFFKTCLDAVQFLQTNLPPDCDRHVFMRLVLSLSTFGFLLSEFDEVVAECDFAISYLKRNYSFYCLTSFYKLKRLCLIKQRRLKDAEKAERMVTNLSEVNDDRGLEALLNIIQ